MDNKLIEVLVAIPLSSSMIFPAKISQGFFEVFFTLTILLIQSQFFFIVFH